MTKQEKHTLRKLIANSKRPALVSHYYEHDQSGKLLRHQVNTMEEIDRLNNSEDFKRGWAECHKTFSELLEFVLTASQRDLIRYAGRVKTAARKGNA